MERKRVWIPVLLLAWTLARTSVARSEEPVASFLQALRTHQYYDVALLYMDRLATRSAVPAAMVDTLAYQRALTLVQAAMVQRDPVAREHDLAAARDSFTQFIGAHPQHADAPIAQRQLGQMLSAWARIELERAGRTNRADLRQQSAELSTQAYAALVLAKEKLKAALLKLKKPADPTMENGDQRKRRETLQGEYLDVQVLAGQALEDHAATLGADDPQRTQLLNQAAALYKGIFDKYGKLGLLGAFNARLGQARVLTQLGRCDAALEILQDDLLDLNSDDPAVRRLKTRGLLQAFSCWRKKPADRKNYELAIRQGQAWLATIRPSEDAETDWLQLKLDLAQVHAAYATLLKKRDPRDVKARSHWDEARKLARAVAKIPSAAQMAAQTLLAELPRGLHNTQLPGKIVPKTFEQARRAGTEALANMRSAQFIIDHVPARLKREPDPDQKKVLREKIDEASATIHTQQRQASDYFSQALRLANAETPLADLNAVRYSLSYLRYLAGEYYDAAVLGEFCARRYPNDALASKAAEIALAAYLKLYEANASDDKQFETDHVV